MAVGLEEPVNLLPVSGVRLAAISANIYKNKRLDLALFAYEEGTVCSAVFTQNAFCAAPVQVAREHLDKDGVKFCIVNAGNANAGTGKQGYEDTLDICQRLSEIDGCKIECILPFSTGVIGEYLPKDNMCSALPELYSKLAENNWNECAKAIMTTDTISKGVSKQVIINGESITLTGIAKGSGMISPNMATMLAFIATDASVNKNVLDKVLNQATKRSFNRICVDGDTSTNDAVLLVATGSSKQAVISDLHSDSAQVLQRAVNDVCLELAQSIIRDGEGASKFITVHIEGGRNEEECLAVADAIATSPLVKTAFFASDPNWGRILAVIGRVGLKDLDISFVDIYLNNLCIVKNGQRAMDYAEESGLAIMAEQEITLRVNLGRGEASETIWTCDLSHDYVRINAEYRS